MHVNQRPTYATKYPPGQSIFLALGQKLLGHPWYGVLLSLSLMCVCMQWMLQGWLPPPYPFWGSLFAGAQFGVANYWGNSYWGGLVAAAGGALVAGALPRMVRRPNGSALFLGACGAAILALSRPYEGLIFTLTCILALVWWRRRERRPLHSLIAPRILVPAVLVVSFAAAWIAYYNYRVTGSFATMPYVVNNRAYLANPLFWILPEGPVPVYRHEILKRFWLWQYDTYKSVRANPFQNILAFRNTVIRFFLPAPLFFAVVIALLKGLSRKVRVVVAIALTLAGGLLLETWLFPHYYAPATSLIVFLVVVGFRSVLQLARRYPRAGHFAVVGLASIVLVAFAVKSAEIFRRPSRQGFGYARRTIIDTLVKHGTRHLVIVRYSGRHNPQEEWVYNRANIDGAEIVWARDMGQSENRALLAYYGDRTVWLLEPDFVPPRLRHYPTNSAASVE